MSSQLFPVILVFLALIATFSLLVNALDPFGDGSRPGLMSSLFLTVTLWVLFFTVWSGQENNRNIRKCEADLPRTQQCVLIAVPVK